MIYCALFLAFSVIAQEPLSVYLPGQINPLLRDAEPQRLSTVLQQLQPSVETYWPAATLGELNQLPELQYKKQLVINQLEELKQRWQGDKAEIISQVMASIERLSLTVKSFRPVDPDLIRLDLTKNPIISGELLFYFPSRPQQIQLLGAVKNPQVMNYQAGWKVKDYLADHPLSAKANRTQAVIIQPDGQVERANIGYWLKPTGTPKPGASIYLEIAGLPSRYAELNDQIIDLLRYQNAWWEDNQ